ncbi:MAG: hypothetical protein KBT27_14975, partial [Prevotellaceae bacterium]|nr:hypothetical protein [Candidatus Faecinaster equi]
EKYSIQNYFNNLYIKGRKNNSVADVVFSTEHEVDQVFESIGEMQWLIYNVNDNTAYHPRSHSEGSGSKGDICVFNSNKLGGHSTWYLRYIDESTLAEVEKKAKQMALNEKLQEKYDEAIILYNKLACYEVDSSETAKMITDPTQLYSHAADPSEGNYANLIDNDVNTFFHTNWHDNAEPEPYAPHELIITLNNPIKGFRFYYTERNSTSYSYRIKNVSIYACNDTVGISDKFEGWSLVKDIVGINFDEFSTEFPATINYDVDMPEEFKFIKFVVMATYPDKRARGGAYPYWNCSEFQMYPSTIVEDKSQYAYVPGMKEAADKMFQLASNAKSLIANDKSTQQSIDELAAAISDVKALFTDTIQFVKLIAECEKFIETSEIGTDVGQVTEDDVNALFEAVEKAKKVSIVDPLDKVTIDNAYTELLNAKQAFIAAMRLFEVGKWYYIISACTERMGDPGTDDAQCFGNAIYANGNNEDQIKWGLYVDGEMTGVYNPHAMWRFVPIEGTSYYAIQCLGSGYYLGEGNGFNTEVKQSFTPTPYTINYLGAGQFSILSMSNSHDQSSTLHAKGINNYIVNFPGDVSSPSSWKLQEVDTENEVEAIINTEFAMNLTDICVLPYNYTSEYFDDNVATYAVQSFEGDAETGYTKVNLYEKSEFEAGESCIIVLGSLNPEDECLPNELLIPFPTELTTEEVPTNGIWGMLHSQIAPKGTAYSTGKSYCVVEDENGVGLGAHTGAFDCRKYTGPVEEEIAYSFTFDNNGKLTGAKGAKKINKAKTSNTIYGVDGECYGDNASNLQNGVYVSGNKKFVK